MELKMEQRIDFLKIEMQLLQSVFNKYDDMIFRSRNWFVTLWMGTISLGVTIRIPVIILLASFLAAFYWTLEGTIRHQYWYKYVIRYRSIRDGLNNVPVNVKDLSIYDLTNHYGARKSSEFERLWKSFGKFEPFVLYLILGLVAVLLWWLVDTGVIVPIGS